MSMLTAVLALALDLGMSKNKRLSGEMEELNRMINEGKRQYEYEKNNIEMINVKCHDLKHQLAAMKGKIYEEQIDELTGLIDIYDSSIKTGNEALDVVLTQKNFYCSRHGIRLTCLLNGKNYDFIPRHELYALFTNIIDNAIEAVENLPEEKRKISITECNVKGFLTVREENCFAGDLKINDGLPVSKKNSTEHGFGVKSMKLIAEKYGGGVSVNTEGDIFVLDIYFCNPET
jgi:signal transduction histidine kinase